MTLMQQWQNLNVSRNSFKSYFLLWVLWVIGKISSRPTFIQKELVQSLAEHF